MATSNFANEITAHLVSKGLNPRPTWMTTFISSQRVSAPLPSLKQTAVFRLIQTDITSSLQAGPHVQVLDIEDIGKSRWSQVEAIEAEERGETTRGREIIRVVPNENGEGDQTRTQPQTISQSQSSGPHKLLLQDISGQRVYGFEVSPVPNVNLNISIGCKLVLRDVIVTRGVLLLDPKLTTFVGGKIEELHNTWKAGRKDALKAAANAHARNAFDST